MAAPEEHIIYNLFDSYWFQHHILTNNLHVSRLPDEDHNSNQDKKYEFVELTTAMSCKKDVEVKEDDLTVASSIYTCILHDPNLMIKNRLEPYFKAKIQDKDYLGLKLFGI
ncbi:hypothetical protein E3N88_00743 [Mikania micrantha]|uniref:Uncharacterized protein n=1 Tax=Mikania micrantha TaxID=192012 RepID=A0A5N6Q0D6_9ASTR|nr:hypothetical protein E3N88_00743 [Mikania micrantha]